MSLILFALFESSTQRYVSYIIHTNAELVDIYSTYITSKS